MPTENGSFRYPQGDAIVDYVTGIIRARNVASVLDVGAGGCATAQRIAASVTTYVAVERDPKRAEALRRGGLQVEERHFPFATAAGYDLVLCSHSLPEGGGELYEEYFAAAFRAVGEGGLLLIITFKGSTKGIFGLRRSPQDAIAGNAELARLERDLSRLTAPVRDSFFSYASATRGPDIAAFFERWLVSERCDDARSRCALRATIEQTYRVKDRFVVPVEHTVFQLAKG